MSGNRNSGRPKKSAAIRQAEGNRGHRRIPSEPIGRGQPKCPGYLSAEQRALWFAVLASAPKGLLCAADQALLEVFVTAWHTLRECNRQIAATELVLRSERGSVKNPLLSIKRMTVADLHMAGADLGMSPSARARLAAPQEDADDPMALLLGLDGPNGAWADPKRN